MDQISNIKCFSRVKWFGCIWWEKPTKGKKKVGGILGLLNPKLDNSPVYIYISYINCKKVLQNTRVVHTILLSMILLVLIFHGKHISSFQVLPQHPIQKCNNLFSIKSGTHIMYGLDPCNVFNALHIIQFCVITRTHLSPHGL